MNYLEEYYVGYDEEGRLASPHGRVEYITTQKYIHECLALSGGRRVLEIGAGTGRYSVALSREGLDVTAVELLEHNLAILKSKLDDTTPLRALQGNALDLGFLPSESFDVTLLLGPMYHLYTRGEQQTALAEAVRVTRPGGYILTAYCMNEPTVVSYVFRRGRLREVLDENMLTEDWHCISQPKDLFALIRTEEIAALDAAVPAERVKLVATDGATRYMDDIIDAMDEQTYAKWIEYHLSVCERPDLIGASHHTLDVLRKL